MKLVSVVIPLFNTEQFIDKAICSIIDQTYRNWELIICDDGSTDNSLSIAREWEKSDSRIKVLANEVNKGHIYTYNRLFFAATGEFIMIQDADDWSDPTRISKQVGVLEAYNVGMCVTNAVFYEPDGKPIYWPKQAEGIININTEEHWAPATNMFRSSVLSDVPGFDSYFDRLTSMDRYFIMEVLDRHKGYYLEEYLYHVQIRPNSDHRSVDLREPMALRKLIITNVYFELKKQRLATGTDWLKEKNFTELSRFEETLLASPELIADKIRVFACIQIDHKQYKNAWKLILQAIKKAPLFLKNYSTVSYFIRSYFISKLKHT